MSEQMPECPHCGSEQATRVSAVPLPDDSYDRHASGIYRCGHCREEYQFLKPLATQTYSPTAECPACKSFHTRTISVHAAVRYHLCLNRKCGHSFKTVRPPTERLTRAVHREA
jgi:transcription elongation factor Elf1